jgi:uncharacterized protein YgbK (DUF1537 family)
VSLAEIRGGGPGRVGERLLALSGGVVCVVNAASERDIQVVALGLLRAEARGKRFLYRTAASFVPARAGLSPRSLLTAAELALPAPGGGLIVAGSYVPRTSAQLVPLRALAGVRSIEVEAAALLAEGGREAAIRRWAAAAGEGLARGEDVLLFTSRELVTGANAEEGLAIARRVSDGLVDLLRAITGRPRYLLAKGGITSSDLATRALGVRRAVALGQIVPGVPVWRLGPESRWAGLAYIVFPGNVGGPTALAETVAGMRPAASED